MGKLEREAAELFVAGVQDSADHKLAASGSDNPATMDRMQAIAAAKRRYERLSRYEVLADLDRFRRDYAGVEGGEAAFLKASEIMLKHLPADPGLGDGGESEGDTKPVSHANVVEMLRLCRVSQGRASEGSDGD